MTLLWTRSNPSSARLFAASFAARIRPAEFACRLCVKRADLLLQRSTLEMAGLYDDVDVNLEHEDIEKARSPSQLAASRIRLQLTAAPTCSYAKNLTSSEMSPCERSPR